MTLNRRSFLKVMGLTAAAVSLLPSDLVESLGAECLQRHHFDPNQRYRKGARIMGVNPSTIKRKNQLKDFMQAYMKQRIPEDYRHKVQWYEGFTDYDQAFEVAYDYKP